MPPVSENQDGADKGQVEEPRPLIEDLEAAFDELESEDESEVEAKSQGEDESETARADDKSDEEHEAEEEDSEEEKSESETLEAQEEESSEEDEDEITIPEAPEHWSQADKEAYGELPDEVKPLWLEKSKSLEAGYQQKFEEVAAQRKELEPYRGIDEVFKPLQQQLAMAGVTPEQYTRQLVATALQLQQDPVTGLRNLAAGYGVTMDDLVGKSQDADDDDLYADPEVKALKDLIAQQASQIQQLSTKFDQSQQATRQASESQILNEWTAFTESKGEDDKPLYPHAADLRQLVGFELERNPPQPTETTQEAFARAYDKVKWTVPEIRESVLAAEKAKLKAGEKSQAKENQRKEDVQKAKRVKKPVKSKSEAVSEAPVVGETWRDELEQQWEQAEAALS